MESPTVQLAVLVPDSLKQRITAAVGLDPGAASVRVTTAAASPSDSVLGFDPSSSQHLIWIVLTFLAGTTWSIVENLIASAIYDQLTASSKGVEVSVRLSDGRVLRLSSDDAESLAQVLLALRAQASDAQE